MVGFGDGFFAGEPGGEVCVWVGGGVDVVVLDGGGVDDVGGGVSLGLVEGDGVSVGVGVGVGLTLTSSQWLRFNSEPSVNVPV